MERPAIDMDSTAERPRNPTTGSALARRILPPGVDGRSAGARRMVDLVHKLAARVADPTDTVVRARLVSAASLIMASERLAHRAAAGEEVDPDEVVRVNNALDRALDRLEAAGGTER